MDWRPATHNFNAQYQILLCLRYFIASFTFGTFLLLTTRRQSKQARVTTMVLMYLELKSPRRRDAARSPMMGTPKAQPLSAAIDRYIKWMSCQGVDLPIVSNVMGTPDYVEPAARMPRPSTPRPMPVKRFRNGILHVPRTLRPRVLGKSVRWRDHEANNKSYGCLAHACGGEGALIDVQDESGIFHSSVPLHRTPTPGRNFSPARDDPILSYRETELTNSRSIGLQRNHYEADMHDYRPQTLKRPPSPHPRANQFSTQSPPPTSPRPVSMRRSSSPHPQKIGHRQVSPVSDDTRQESQSRSRNELPGPPPMRRTRGRSQSPAAPSMPTAHQSPATNPTQRPSPRAFGMRRSTSRDSSVELRRGRDQSASPVVTSRMVPPPQRRGTPLQRRDPPQRGSTPQQQLRRSSGSQSFSRQGREEPQRYAELPGKGKQFSELPGRDTRFAGELPGRVSQQRVTSLPAKPQEPQYAEIVWKSKEEPIVVEKKKKGWKLVRRSSRKQQPQPESPQWRRGGEQDEDEWVSQDNSIVDEYDEYDRYGNSNY
jgi:hypothetical protein